MLVEVGGVEVLWLDVVVIGGIIFVFELIVWVVECGVFVLGYVYFEVIVYLGI